MSDFPQPSSLSDPLEKAEVVNIGAADHVLAGGGCRALWVGGAGNLVCRFVGQKTNVTILNVPAGSLLPFRLSRVVRTSTTASSMVALR